MILFIHGFASCGVGDKSRALIDFFGRDQVLTPDLSFRPAEAISQLESLLASHPVKLMIGSSLGGYYATWLNRPQRGASIPSVLINPAIAPYRLLNDYLGPQQRWCDGQRFELVAEDIAALKAMYRPTLEASESYRVLLQTDDEVLDYREAATYYAQHLCLIDDGGSHRYDHFEHQLPGIAAWLNDVSHA